MENHLDYRSYGGIPSTNHVAVAGNQGIYSAASRNLGTPVFEGGTQSSGPPSLVGPAHVVLGLARPSTGVGNVESSTPAKRTRKERGANWNPLEVTGLIEAKRNQYLEELDTVDGRHLMTADAGKWQRISVDVMKARVSPCHRDGGACKSKWNLLIPEYKKISDFLARTGTNEACYWNLSAAEKKKELLPRTFSEEVFFRIHSWFGSTPTVMPPHSRDLLSAENGNYRTPTTAGEDGDDDDCSEDNDSDDPLQSTPAATDTDDVSVYSQPPGTSGAPPKSKRVRGVSYTSPGASPSATARRSILAGMTLQFISSSDTAEETPRRRPGTTGVKRKNVSGHALIPEATRATGETMSGQMKDMADASRDLEKSKIEAQFRLFTEQMEYQRERDRRLHENARLVNNNAKLAIDKQSEVVTCLSQLASVLSVGLKVRDDLIQLLPLGASIAPVTTTTKVGSTYIPTAEVEEQHTAPASLP